MADAQHLEGPQTLIGHHTCLFALFFAEMWERFSYYGMRALLVFYMIKGFLKYGDSEAYTVYGAYTALVYMTPFFGGMLADRLLGARRAVVLGGLLMAAGHLMMTIENSLAFFAALALLILGNGFFKPNISAMVGSLYPEGSHKRDGGFTIFYMGINLGAAMSPLLCGYIGETFGWHYGFGLATIGMITGTAIFVAPSLLAQTSMFLVALIAAMNIFIVPQIVGEGSPVRNYCNIVVLACLAISGIISFAHLRRGRLEESLASKLLARVIIMAAAVAAAIALFMYRPDNPFSMAVNIFVGLALLVAGAIAWTALGRGGLPTEAGAPPDEKRLLKPVAGLLSTEYAVYLAVIVLIPVFVLFVSGLAPLTEANRSVSIIPDSVIQDMEASESPVMQVLAVVVSEISKPAGLVLMLSGIVALVYLGIQTFKLDTVPRQRMYVVLILTFFALLFWSFFEQAGSSVNNFTDRNVDRVLEQRTITADEVGTTIAIQPTQEQLGYRNGDQLFTLSDLDALREANSENPNFEIQWTVAEDNVGMGVADRLDEIPASVFQSVNPIFIMIFGLAFTALWAIMDKFGLEPSTPFKFAMGLFQLGLGFAAFWFGAQAADERGMVVLAWLLLGYLLQTTGELCLSPVGLSMVTKLSPAQLVSTVMGTWFLATAFSQYLAAIIAQFTRIEHGEGGAGAIPIPSETVHVYGNVFGKIAIAAIISSVICFALVPLLRKWMHEEAIQDKGASG